MARVQGMVALNSGFKSFSIYEPRDLSLDFKIRNAETLTYSRGAGFWIWKPRIILDHLKKIAPDEIVLYLDCGVLPNLLAEEYCSLIVDERIHLWALNGESYLEWTDPDVLSQFANLDDTDFGMIQAGIILAKNTKNFTEFLEEWLSRCEKPNLLRPETLPNYQPSSKIKWHRHDQSLLNILVRENTNSFIITNRARPGESILPYFDIHRNLYVKTLFHVRLYPSLRLLRHKIINVLPISLRIVLRQFWSRKKKKNIDERELKAISRGFNR